MTISDTQPIIDDSNEIKTLPPFIRRSCSLLKKPTYHPAKVSVGHWQLRDLIHHSTNHKHPNEILYTFENTIRTTNKNTNKVSLVHQFDFHPRCFSVSDANIVSGGVVSSLSISSHNITPSLMGNETAYLNPESPKGLLGLYNRDTDESLTVKLGSFINNHVTLNKSSNYKFNSFVCNNDMNLYSTTIHNSSIEFNGSINLNFPLNHSTLSDDGKTLIVVGDSTNIYLLHPGQDQRSLTRDNVIETACDSGFSTSFDSSGLHFATCFQDGTCMIYDLRNYSKGPLHKISSTRKNTSNGAFRCVKYSHGTEDLLFISEHIGRVHMVDTRDFSNHQIIMLPVNTIQSRHPASHQMDQRADPDATIFKPAVLTYDEVVGFEDHSRHNDTTPLDITDEGTFGFGYVNNVNHQNHSRNTTNFNVLSSLTSALEEDEYESEEEEDEEDEEEDEEASEEASIDHNFQMKDDILKQMKSTKLKASSHKKTSTPSSETANLPINENNGEHLNHSRSSSFGSEYDYMDNEISGIDWYQDLYGSHLVVGCDKGLIDWTIDSWSRRSFPSYQLL